MQSGRKTGPCGSEGRRRQVLKLVPADLKGEESGLKTGPCGFEGRRRQVHVDWK